ncbi:MAG TPA: UbiA-like polyprenyltransferase [Longimicrobiales bacterium]|nr:UbiA-like polyprenyltransferase [Longimicrobiales bacterium]
MVREGQVFRGGSLATRYASFVKLPHTFFALPFAGVGAVLASWSYAGRVTPLALLWIVIAFTAARFAAMGFNRIVDRHWDAVNPRTAARELPSGRLSTVQAAAAVAAASAIFVLSAWLLNPLCGALAPVALAWIFFYSYTKRFTSWAHHVLGLALGIAPAGAYLAIAGVWPSPWYALPVLVAAVMFWVAGFDVIYAVQDVDFDRAHGLHSIPARHGVLRGLRLAGVFHLVSFVLFAAVHLAQLFPVGDVYLLGVLAVAGLLVHEHRIARVSDARELDLARVDRAFFRVNIGVSFTIFTFTLLDRLLPRVDLLAGLLR